MRRCYVVMTGEDEAGAACVITPELPNLHTEFLTEHSGADIRTVSAEEAKRLLGNYFNRRSGEPEQLPLP